MLHASRSSSVGGSNQFVSAKGDRAADRHQHAASKCFLDMLGMFAEFETNLRRERQLEGIGKAKAEAVYKGRKRSIDLSQVEKLKAERLGAIEIAKRMKIGRASVYRVLAP